MFILEIADDKLYYKHNLDKLSFRAIKIEKGLNLICF